MNVLSGDVSKREFDPEKLKAQRLGSDGIIDGPRYEASNVDMTVEMTTLIPSPSKEETELYERTVRQKNKAS